MRKKLKEKAIKYRDNDMDRYWLFVYEVLPQSDLTGDYKTLKEDKITFINNEIVNKFDNIDKQKEFLKNDAERMKHLLQVLETNKDNYNKLLTSLVLKNRTKNAQLEENDTFKKLRELEKKMQVNENNIYSLQSYIESKTDENQFGHLLKDCMALQEQINEILIKNN